MREGGCVVEGERDRGGVRGRGGLISVWSDGGATLWIDTALRDKLGLQQSSCCGLERNFERAERGLETDGPLSGLNTKDAFH